MAKTDAKAEKTAETTAAEQLPVTVVSNLPAHLMADAQEFAGAGMSDRQQDFLLPFLYVAQSNSPQLKKQQADKYIEGLQAGDIFNTATGEFWRGDTGLEVHHAFFQAAEVEWVTRKAGGGYVATHQPSDPIVKTVRIDPSDPRVRLVAPGADGKAHQLVETRYHFVILPSGSPAVLGMASTGLQTSRQWMTLMREFKAPGADGRMITLPTWSRKYRIKTVYRTNDQGDWFQVVVQDAGWSGPDCDMQRQMARQFYKEAMERGVVLGRPPEDAPVGGGEEVRAPRHEGEEPPI